MRATKLGLLVVIMCGLGAASARADAGADAGKAFAAFVDGVAAGKPLPPGLELFITPIRDDIAAPGDLAAVKAMLPAPKVKVLQVMVSKGGKSAWIAAEITATVKLAEKKPKADVIRSSAFLAFDGAAWTVRAVHWSVAVKNVKPEMCGMIDSWDIDPDVPTALAPAVAKLLATLDEDQPASFVALLSNDKRAQVFGSAPKETFAGAKVKSVFKKWSVSLPGWDRDDPALPARAGTGPDGELAWIATGVAYVPLCMTYRTFFVLAKEGGEWKIIHQHYSEPIYTGE